MEGYRQRIMDKLLAKKLQAKGAVLIEGPKWCGKTLIDEGADTLTALSNQIDTTRMKAPAFRMILTATGDYAYRRPKDGIYVVPIGCLGI